MQQWSAPERADFWRGAGFADARMTGCVSDLERFAEAVNIIPELQPATLPVQLAYLEGLGESLLHTHTRYSLRYLQYDYYFAIRSKREKLVVYPDALRIPLARGLEETHRLFLR